ncbi:hypothetical protein PAT3040_01814 [Paenibacillus agaridevorans]|uniref:Uncharacterized protein n=1 Tax=Paenibacillus agaridevorans TaxID=171404 RepID=A0A2R5EKU5_9BACL|nr:hypothetical protein [Paenibacillus agaridevorans]GBG07266.1 hypothetical protein PAT3040_01814 [Paenibacillus agaridevorans]
MNEFEQSADNRHEQRDKRDNPDGIPTEKESLFDKFVSQRTVNSNPVEDRHVED